MTAIPPKISRPPRAVWVGFLLFFLLFIFAFSLWFWSVMKNPPVGVIGRVDNFALTNQDNHVTTLADLTNHVWVADVIFTRCAGQCPRMTMQMKSLQDKLAGDPLVKLVSFTTDPDHDTPAVLKKYGERAGANFHHWMFLTGKKREIARVAGNSLKLSAQPIKLADRKSPVDLFIHSTIFVLVDKHARLRTFFQTGGAGVTWSKVEPDILRTIHDLEYEP